MKSGEDNTYRIGGRTFVSVGESTVEQDYRFLALITRAGLDRMTLRPGESPEEFARRLLEHAISSGVVLELLGCLLIPPSDSWTPDIASDTAAFLGGLTTPDDKTLVNALILSLLVSFFEHGIVSLQTLTTSSDQTTPAIPEMTTISPSAPGRSLWQRLRRAIMTGHRGSFAGRSARRSSAIGGS